MFGRFVTVTMIAVMVIAHFAEPAAASGLTRLHIGTSLGAVDRAWAPDRTARPLCNFAYPVACRFYVYHGIHIVVGSVNSQVTDVVIGGYVHPGASRYWHFLLSLLPTHVRRLGCKSVRTTVHLGRRNGQAWACLYQHGSQRVLVAQHFVPTDRSIEGEVRLNATYVDLKVPGM
jgi:hypothetical protein